MLAPIRLSDFLPAVEFLQFRQGWPRQKNERERQLEAALEFIRDTTWSISEAKKVAEKALGEE